MKKSEMLRVLQEIININFSSCNSDPIVYVLRALVNRLSEEEEKSEVKDELLELRRENEVLREKVMWPQNGTEFTIIRSKDYEALVKAEARVAALEEAKEVLAAIAELKEEN